MGRFGGAERFTYLGDGDGFPTGTKNRYWDSFGYTLQQKNEDFGLRTLAQETVESGSYLQRGTGAYTPNEFNTSTWRDNRLNPPLRGGINYLRLEPEEAGDIYWKLRGFKVSLAQEFLTETAKGGRALVQPDTILDSEFGTIGQPINRVWSADNLTIASNSARDDFSKVWETDQYGNKYTVSGIVEYQTKLFPSWTRLARYPTSKSGADYGFETLFEATYQTQCGQNSKDPWNRGSRSSIVQIYIGSQFFFPEDNIIEQEEFRELEKFKLYKIEFDGVPLLVLERKVISDAFAFFKTAKEYDVVVDDIRLWAFQGVQN